MYKVGLGQPTTRLFTFDIRISYVPLQQSLKQVKTAIYNTWPEFDKHLPEYATIASTHANLGKQQIGAGGVLMSQPIHVIEGDTLEVTLINNLDSTGLSIHWHGFEMINSLEYDGVVGITQCALAPQETMVYKFQVDETPGTYWYHTHNGALGVNAKNEIKAPLIVHPRTNYSESLVKELNESTESLIEAQGSFDSLNFYNNERLLFFADGYLVSESQKQLKKVGGLNPPVSKNDDGFTVGSFPYHYGTCNGKLREVIPVEAGQKYKFRLLNGGTLYGFRISIDGLPMTIVAADSEPVVPYEVDEVILHSAERFDVEIDIPLDMANTTVWIRADTLESTMQGYQNGVRAILNVMSPGELTTNNNSTSPIVLESPKNIPDPIEDIVSSDDPIFERRRLNCNSRSEIEQAKNRGECVSITELASLKEEELDDNNSTSGNKSAFTESHTVDFEFSPPPSHAHFVRIDGGLYNQHVNPLNSHFLQPGLKLHENTAMLHVSSFSSVLIVWRTKSLMDHPVHLHGYKMEILDIYRPKRELHCSRASCELPAFYDSKEKLQELDARIRHAVLKDTFILPAGGAVVTRIHTFEPAVWFAHCHLETHREDGMALIVNVGNYTAPEDSSWLPDDFPSCDHPFLKGLHEEPACTCYQDKDAVLDQGLTEDYRCSRDYLCSHVDSEVSQLSSYKPSGVSMRSQYRIPNYGLTLIFLAIVSLMTLGVSQINRILHVSSRNKVKQDEKTKNKREFEMTKTLSSKKGISHLVSSETSQHYFSTLDFWTQLKLLTVSQFKAYRPTCVNVWRIVEVSSLASLVGLLFYDVGNKESAESLTQKSGLLFFSVTLWTFTRMYPAVGSTSIWRNLAIDFSSSFRNKNTKMKYVFILWLARVIVLFVCESWLPLIHVLVAYPMAGMFGRIDSCFKISLFLMMNNLCYVSIGSFLGAITSNVSIGMIVSTLVSQTSLLAAGFYTTLPPVINLLRYISPVTYTYTGILKSTFRSTDTYKCRSGGQSDVGVNQCYIEQSVGIDILKRRGINMATFNDPYTESIWMEIMILFGLYVLLNCAVLGILLFRIYRRKEGDADMIGNETMHFANVMSTPNRKSSSNRFQNADAALDDLSLDLDASIADHEDYITHLPSRNRFHTSVRSQTALLGLERSNQVDLAFLVEAVNNNDANESSRDRVNTFFTSFRTTNQVSESSTSTLENENVSANKNEKKSNRERKDNYVDNPSVDEFSC